MPFLGISGNLTRRVGNIRIVHPVPSLSTLLSGTGGCPMFNAGVHSIVCRPGISDVRLIIRRRFSITGRVVSGNFVPVIRPRIGVSDTGGHSYRLVLGADLLRGLSFLSSNRRMVLGLALPRRRNFCRRLISRPGILGIITLSNNCDHDTTYTGLGRGPNVVTDFSHTFARKLDGRRDSARFTSAVGASVGRVCRTSGIWTVTVRSGVCGPDELRIY